MSTPVVASGIKARLQRGLSLWARGLLPLLVHAACDMPSLSSFGAMRHDVTFFTLIHLMLPCMVWTRCGTSAHPPFLSPFHAFSHSWIDKRTRYGTRSYRPHLSTLLGSSRTWCGTCCPSGLRVTCGGGVTTRSHLGRQVVRQHPRGPGEGEGSGGPETPVEEGGGTCSALWAGEHPRRGRGQGAGRHLRALTSQSH